MCSSKLKLLNAFCLLLAFNSATRHENEAINTWVEVTSDVAGSEKLELSSYQRQISRDPVQDSQTESKRLHCLLSSQQHVNNTGSVDRAVDNTGYNDRPKRYVPTSHVCVLKTIYRSLELWINQSQLKCCMQ